MRPHPATLTHVYSQHTRYSLEWHVLISLWISYGSKPLTGVVFYGRPRASAYTPLLTKFGKSPSNDPIDPFRSRRLDFEIPCSRIRQNATKRAAPGEDFCRQNRGNLVDPENPTPRCSVLKRPRPGAACPVRRRIAPNGDPRGSLRNCPNQWAYHRPRRGTDIPRTDDIVGY